MGLQTIDLIHISILGNIILDRAIIRRMGVFHWAVGARNAIITKH